MYVRNNINFSPEMYRGISELVVFGFRSYVLKTGSSNIVCTTKSCIMPRTSKKDRHQLEEATAKHKLNLDNDEQGTEDNSSIGSPARGIENDSESHKKTNI